MGAAEKMCM